MRSVAPIVLGVLLQGCDSSGTAPTTRPDGGVIAGGASGANSSSGGSLTTSAPAGGLVGAGGTIGSGGTAGASGGAGTGGTDQSGMSGAATGDGGRTMPDASVPPPPAAIDGPTAAAFDERTGKLFVDYAAFLSKHDVVYSKPNSDPLRGLTVGNGRTGAMAWDANGITMQVSGVDTSEQTAFSAGRITFQTSPPLDAGASAFSERLSLYEGTLTTTYGSGRSVTIFGAPDSEVLGVHVEDSRPAVSSATFELGIWDVSRLGNSGAVPNLDTWKTTSTYAESASAGMSRGQKDPNHFGYTLAATVEGTAFKATAVDQTKVRLEITPAASYTIWLTASTRLHASNNDSVAAAKSALAKVRADGHAATFAAYRRFWRDFWTRSFVQYAASAGASDYLENVYYLATYMIAAGGFGHYPFHFINGVFRATNDDTKWSNAYWYWNQRDVYNSFLASNHADVLHVFNAMYSGVAPALRSFTQSHYGLPGIWVPETMGFDGNASGTTGSDFTKNIYSTGTEAALNMYLESQYTGDMSYLSSTAYPFMRDVANFYVAKLSKDSGGQYYMASSNAHETYWNVKNAITDLAAVRSLFPLVIATSRALGMDDSARAQWQTVLDHLVPYPTDATTYLPHEPPTSQIRNGENVACELIWPYGVTGIGAPDYDRAVATWKARPFPYGNVWANDAIQAARLGLADDAYKGMITMLQKYQSYPNGMTNNTNGVFEYLGVHLSAMNEALLQSYDDRIRVFPAMPADPSFLGRFTLLAKGGFLVSSERENAEIKYVGLKSNLGNIAHLVNPWGSASIRVRNTSDGSIVASSSSTSIDIPTTAGAVYVIEREAKPLSAYTKAHIGGTANLGVKHLAGTMCALGM